MRKTILYLAVLLCLLVVDVHAFQLIASRTAAPAATSLSCAPSSWDPADGTDGDAAATQEFTCTATGTVDISSVAVGGGNSFADDTTGSCNSLPTLTNGQTCTVDLTFTYAEGGPYSDTLTVASDADDSPEEVGLGPVTVSGAAAEIAREGYQERALSDSETSFAWSVTIPANTSAIVITAHAYSFYGGEPLVSANLNGTQNFTIDNSIDPASDAGVGIGHLFSPASTGVQTVNIVVGAHGYAGYLWIIYYSGTATDGLRDNDEIGGTSLTLTTQAGDYVVSAATDGDNTSISWTNATEIDEYAAPAAYGMAIAETVANGITEQISTSGSNVGLVAIVLKPGS